MQSLGIIPLGSGNGFARHFNIPKNLNNALNIISENFSTIIDVGKINNTFFFNNFGLGLEARFIHEYSKKEIRGLKGYIISFFKTIPSFKKQKIEIEFNNRKKKLFPFFFLVSNTSQQGYNFSITPKAGFLSMLAGFFCRIKFRLHYFTGQVWVTRKGFQRFFLRNIDRLMGFLATDVLTECNSQKKFLEDENIVKKDRLTVLANGSICGVDTTQFKPDLELKHKVRSELGISDDSILLLFLGRLNKDKGVLDLALAVKNLNLLIIGSDEENIKSQVQSICHEILDKIHFMNFTDQPEKFMAAADIFCLPSYREGFGMAALEAGACALPTVTSRIYGLTDAVSENETGLFHDPGDIKGIEQSISKLIKDENLRLLMGKKGRERTKNLFEKSYVTTEFVKYIKNLN